MDHGASRTERARTQSFPHGSGALVRALGLDKRRSGRQKARDQAPKVSAASAHARATIKAKSRHQERTRTDAEKQKPQHSQTIQDTVSGSSRGGLTTGAWATGNSRSGRQYVCPSSDEGNGRSRQDCSPGEEEEDSRTERGRSCPTSCQVGDRETRSFNTRPSATAKRAAGGCETGTADGNHLTGDDEFEAKQKEKEV